MAGKRDIKLAADIGGTFTDIVLESGRKRWSGKVLTTTEAPELGVMEGIVQVLGQSGVAPEDVGVFIHGTTPPPTPSPSAGRRTASSPPKASVTDRAGYENLHHHDLMTDRLPSSERSVIPCANVSADGEVLVLLEHAGCAVGRGMARMLMPCRGLSPCLCP
jgi:N-methylhydantoinase A